MALEAPKIEPLEGKLMEKLLDKFKGQTRGWGRVGEKGYIFPCSYAEQGQGFYNFKSRASDTWVLSYPRSGTTWTQEMVWMLSNNLNFKKANENYLAERFPFLEFSMFFDPERTKQILSTNQIDEKKKKHWRDFAVEGYKVLDNVTSPRFIKSHFPLSLLPGILDSGCKIVYVARNPKDVAVSWYHLNCDILTQGYTGDFEEFWYFFRNDLTPWSPYWEHVKEAWAQRNHENLLFLFYEEMQWDLRAVIERVARFLGKTYDNDEITKLINYLDIKNFRENRMVNSSELRECGIITTGNFVRKGKSGGWREYFTDEMEASADSWIEENLRDTDLRFPSFPVTTGSSKYCDVAVSLECNSHSESK